MANALAGAAPDTDVQAPTPVGDLVAAAADFQSVVLSWTATGDDGPVGRASFYDLRYSTTPITDATWHAATPDEGEPGPRPAGAAESFTVAGLDPGTTYYFALKVRDEMGNESPLSAVAAATTAPAATLFGDWMESGANGWAATGLWHQSALRSYSRATSWYYGDEATRTYDTGTANRGTLTSPVINLKNASHPVLIFREWRQLEDVANSVGDTAAVQIGTGPNQWQTVSASQFSTAVNSTNWQYRSATLGWNAPVPSSDPPQWVSRALDPSAYVGKTVQLPFAISTGDAAFNDFEGWYVDDVNVFDAGGARAALVRSAAGGRGSTAAPPVGSLPVGAALVGALDRTAVTTCNPAGAFGLVSSGPANVLSAVEPEQPAGRAPPTSSPRVADAGQPSGNSGCQGPRHGRTVEGCADPQPLDRSRARRFRRFTAGRG